MIGLLKNYQKTIKGLVKALWLTISSTVEPIEQRHSAPNVPTEAINVDVHRHRRKELQVLVRRVPYPVLSLAL